MADPTNLLDLRIAQRDAATNALTDAEAAHVTARDAATAARLHHRDQRVALAAREAELADTRRRLADPGLQPADAAALADALRDQIIAWRRARAAVLDAAGAEITAEATLNAVASQATAVAGRQARAVRDQGAAADRAVQLQGWRDALAASPLATLEADATAALAPGAEPFTAARSRVETDLPAPLRARAQARHARARILMAEREQAARAAADQRDAADQADGGVEGALVPLSTAVARAEHAFGTFVRHGRMRFSQALDTLRRVADATPLSDDQRARLHDAAALADRTEAADRAGDLEAARTALDDAQRDLASARRVLVGEDADSVIDDSHPVLAPLLAALAPLQQNVTDAETAFTAAHAETLDRWEAAVPDALWRQHIAFEDANAVLDAVAPNPDPAALDATLVAAEAAWVAALLHADRRQRTHEHLARVATRLDTHLVSHQRLARAQVLSAVRGDR